MGDPRRRPRDLGSALFLLLFGLAAVFEASRLVLGNWGRPGPGFLPLSAALALSAMALALLGRAAWRRWEGPAEGPGTQERAQWGKVVGALAAMLIYAFVLEPLGFLVATSLLMLFLFRAIEPRPWATAVGASLATTLAAYGLFKVWLGLRLPRGILPL